jgi:hypothetical protein|tara:strand:+ start:4959 stop:5210 length:252 start_codon:yes stop_codon:yes gene_type:complete
MSEVPEDRLTAQLDFEDDMRENPEFYRKYLTEHRDDSPEDVQWDPVVDKWVVYYNNSTLFFDHEEAAREWYRLNTLSKEVVKQ